MLTIRLGTTEDIRLLGDVESRADAVFEAFPDLVPHDGETASAELLQQAIDGQCLWVAENDAELIGFCFVILFGGSAHFEQLSVVPEHQGKSVGSMLLTQAVQWAESKGFKTLTLSTFSAVPWNKPFYERKGFVVMDESEMTGELTQLRDNETAAGLDVSQRVFMKRNL